MTQHLVAVSTDVKEFDNYRWHATPEQYVEAALSVAGVLPVMVPSLGQRINFDDLLSSVDGVMITGSKSNVMPDRYGAEVVDRHGPYDPDRDATTLPLIRKAIEHGVPLLAICRGIQELNVALGGTLTPAVHERKGAWNHRAPEIGTQDERFAIRQPVTIKPGSCLADIFGPGDIQVNSLHWQGIDRLGPRLQVEALAHDGTVEAVSVKGAPAFAVGVQWHPEYWASSDDASGRIFRAFGDAVRAHAAARFERPEAAE